MMYSNGKPKMCNLSITLGCMLRCKICYHWQNDEKDIARPTLNEWKRFIYSLQREVDSDFTIVFGGGEPLLYPKDLIELIAFSSSLGFKTALATSGHTINEIYVQDLVRAGLKNIDLTIFSLNNKMHDFIRGIDGSLERVLKAIDYLAQFKDFLKIGINTIIMKPSLNDLLELTEWVNNNSRLLGIYYQAVMRPFHTPFVEEWYKREEYRILWPDDLNKLESIIDTLITLKQRGYRIANPIAQFVTFKSFFRNPSGFVKPLTCNLINGRFFALNSDGSLTLCPYTKPLGKITESNFQQLWYSDQVEVAKGKIKKCKINCHHLVNCWFEEELNGQR